MTDEIRKKADLERKVAELEKFNDMLVNKYSYENQTKIIEVLESSLTEIQKRAFGDICQIATQALKQVEELRKVNP